MSFPDFDPRINNAELAISFVEEYFKLVESKMEEARLSEMAALDASYPPDTQQQYYGEYSALKSNLEYSYDQGLVRVSRYSFVVLLHILVETQMRVFCSELQKEKKLPSISLSDFRGSPIEQSQLFLTKLVEISPQHLPEWQHLKTLQKVRDCIVHAYGDVKQSRDEKELRRLARQGRDIEIDVHGKLSIKKNFCDDQIKNILQFFRNLFTKAGWEVQ